MAKHDAKVIEEAAKLYCYYGKSLSELEKMPQFPTRQTMAKWAKDGLSMNGKDWDTVRKDVEKERAEQARSLAFTNSRKQFVNLRDKAKDDIDRAIVLANQQLADAGARNMSYSELKNLYEFRMKLEAGTANEQILSYFKDFLDDVGAVILRECKDLNEVQKIHLELKTILNKYSERLDPIKQLLKN